MNNKMVTERIVVEKLPLTRYDTWVIRYVPTPGLIRNVSIRGISRFKSKAAARKAIKAAGGAVVLKRKYRKR